jgi:hypothetical protein
MALVMQSKPIIIPNEIHLVESLLSGMKTFRSAIIKRMIEKGLDSASNNERYQ